MASKIIEEALLSIKDVEGAVQQTAKALLNEKINRVVNEKVNRIFEEEEKVEKEDEEIKEEKKAKDEHEAEETPEEEAAEEAPSGEGEEVELDLSKMDEEVGDAPVNVDALGGMGEEKEAAIPEEEELKEVYESIMKEMTVGGLPKDVTALDKETKTPAEKGWEDGEPEGNEKKFAVKESRTLKALLKLYKRNLVESKRKDAVISEMTRKMRDINLFNSKLLYSARLLGESVFTTKERKNILATFDAAKSINECKAIYNAYAKGLTMIKSRLSESTARKIGGLNRSVLKENRASEDTSTKFDTRSRILAGIHSDEE